MLYDININEGTVGHQHIDHIYYATVPNRNISPEDGEEGPESWQWYTIEELQNSNLPPDVVQFGIEAIQAAENK